MSTLQIVLVLLAASVILLWLTLAVRGPRKVETPHVLAVLRHGSALRVLALVLALAPPMLMIFAVGFFSWRNDATLTQAGAAFLATSLLAGLLLVEAVKVQIVLTEDGITRTSPWRGTTTLRWSDIERIRYSAVNRWFVVQSATATIRVSRHLVGLRAFAAAVRQRVPADRWTSAAADLPV